MGGNAIDSFPYNNSYNVQRDNARLSTAIIRQTNKTMCVLRDNISVLWITSRSSNIPGHLGVIPEHDYTLTRAQLITSLPNKPNTM